MRAGVLYAQHDLRVEERPDPIPGPGDVVIEVSYNGLCGTDATEYGKASIMVPLEVVHPGSGHVGPTILGHEFIGTVVGAASDAMSWIGKRVACGAGVSCGECAWCRRGRTNLCEQYYTIGLSTDGGLARVCRGSRADLSRDSAVVQRRRRGLSAASCRRYARIAACRPAKWRHRGVAGCGCNRLVHLCGTCRPRWRGHRDGRRPEQARCGREARCDTGVCASTAMPPRRMFATWFQAARTSCSKASGVTAALRARSRWRRAAEPWCSSA